MCVSAMILLFFFLFFFLSFFFFSFLFFFNDTATTEIYTLSLHDALPICLALCDVDLLYLDRGFQLQYLF